MLFSPFFGENRFHLDNDKKDEEVITKKSTIILVDHAFKKHFSATRQQVIFNANN
jgi:hypothetical protein